MKNKFLAAMMILVVTVLVASCATSRKYGCPMAQVSTQKANS